VKKMKQKKVPADLVYDFLKENQGKEYSTADIMKVLKLSYGSTRTALKVLRIRHMIFMKQIMLRKFVYFYNSKNENFYSKL